MGEYTGKQETRDGIVLFEREYCVNDDPGEYRTDENGRTRWYAGPMVYETQWVPASSVTVYAVERCYGGPEEGGWWFDRRTVRCAIPTDGTVADIEAATNFLAGRFPNSRPGRSSVNGGPDYAIVVEPVAGLCETQGRPRYE